MLILWFDEYSIDYFNKIFRYVYFEDIFLNMKNILKIFWEK